MAQFLGLWSKQSRSAVAVTRIPSQQDHALARAVYHIDKEQQTDQRVSLCLDLFLDGL